MERREEVEAARSQTVKDVIRPELVVL